MAISSTSMENKILNTARELFVKKGILSTEMKDISQSLGCSRSTLYRYYPGKADIIMALATEAIKIFSESVSIPTSLRFSTGYEAIEWQINSLIESMIIHREEVAFIRDFDCVFTAQYPTTSNLLGFSEAISKADAAHSILENFKHGIADGSIRDVTNPELTVLTIIQGCYGIAQRILPREHIYIDEYGYGQEMLRTFTKLVLNSVKGK